MNSQDVAVELFMEMVQLSIPKALQAAQWSLASGKGRGKGRSGYRLSDTRSFAANFSIGPGFWPHQQLKCAVFDFLMALTVLVTSFFAPLLRKRWSTAQGSRRTIRRLRANVQDGFNCESIQKKTAAKTINQDWTTQSKHIFKTHMKKQHVGTYKKQHQIKRYIYIHTHVI